MATWAYSEASPCFCNRRNLTPVYCYDASSDNTTFMFIGKSERLLTK